jgi:hypothetical protein
MLSEGSSSGRVQTVSIKIWSLSTPRGRC